MSDVARLVVPSKIPGDQMKGPALEELLYWLCEAMGAQDLHWRAGSAAGTSRDRGRDLEATFHVPEPGGALRPERWWFQAKGRASTVEPNAVKEAVVDVQAHEEVDVLVIATNTRISNDTRDWVGEFQTKNTRPSVRVWEHPDLERMVIAHPSVVARVAPEALSIEGQLAAASAAYWNRLELPPHGQLDRFWEHRTSLEFSTGDLVMLVIAEAARAGLADRPWGAELDPEAVTAALTMGVANVPALLFRGERIGHGSEPLLLGLVHLIGCGLTRLPARAIAELLEDPWRFVEGSELDDDNKAKIREYLIDPVIQRLRSYIGTACMADCVRLFGELEPEVARSPEQRWLEFLPSGAAPPSEPPKTSLILIEERDAPCRAGLPLDAERGCPFGGFGDDLSWEALLTDLQAVLVNRLAQAAKAHGEDPPA